MKTIDRLLGQVVPAARAKSVAHEREQQAGHENGGGFRDQRDHVDAINQAFVEFELAYHNQFHKAYAQEGSLNLAKKYWLGRLADFPPEVILRAARQLVLSQEYLPTLAAMVASCESALPLFGLPPARAAYVEACCAPEPKSACQWSHPAVYLAGRATGWFRLASETESAVFPLFDYHYQQLCARVLRGERLDTPIPVALSQTAPRPLDHEEGKARIRALREKLGLV